MAELCKDNEEIRKEAGLLKVEVGHLRTEMNGMRDELRQEIQAVAQNVGKIDRCFDELVEEAGKNAHA